MSEQVTPTENTSDKMDALAQALKVELHTQQDIVYAIVGGLSAAVLSAVLWAVITVSTEHQIGYMAVAVGLLVGYGVRIFGAGIDFYFGLIGSFFALLGCALGNLLSQVGFIAATENLGYFEVITLLNADVIADIYKESFSPIDVLFYGIAAYGGYKVSFRNIAEELTEAVSAGKVLPPPFARFRLPVVITLFVGLSILTFVVSRGSDEVRTFTYESGSKRAEGALTGGRETGPWQTWWENGNVQAHGLYTDGQLDSLWTYYDEEGQMTRQVSYKMGIQHGPTTDYYADGTVATQGQYKNGRQDGLWVIFSAEGYKLAQGSYLLDENDGDWEYYHSNGHVLSEGRYLRGKQIGIWTDWTDAGKKKVEFDYGASGKERIINMWNEQGKQVITNGSGQYKSYYDENGTVLEAGPIRDGYRSGNWKRYYANGSVQIESEYQQGDLKIIKYWDTEGNETATAGEGYCEGYMGNESQMERGEIKRGLREGKWELFMEDGNIVLRESNYVGGKLEGVQRSYYTNGQVQAEGSWVNGQREGEWKWYDEGGAIESTATFVDGKKDGIQYFFDEDGELVRTESYKMGELVEVEAGS
jgi:antitoxin component YwqK of YwqJK toxin-antitoxin module